MKFKVFTIMLILTVISITAVFWEQSQTSDKTHVKIPVLLYHDFVPTVPDSDPDNFNYINTPQSFDENIRVLLENGYTFMSFQELNDIVNGKQSIPDKPIVITMDDGYYSNYEYIYPILQKYNVKASIFIVTDNIGQEISEKKYLTWEQCSEMQNSGLVEILSHSKRHIFYDKLPARSVYNDVAESYKVIQEHLGNTNFKVFAYPYGAYTKETVWVLKTYGIDMQVYDIGMNYLSNFNKDYIKRINIPCEMTGTEIIEEINNTN